MQATRLLSRRNFLKLSSVAAIASTGVLASCSSLSSGGADPAPGPGAIDIHNHFFPPELLEEVKQHGKTLGIEYLPPKDGRDSPLSIRFPGGNRLNLDRRLADLEKRLEVMRAGKVGMVTLEVQTSAVGYELDSARGEAWSRLLQRSASECGQSLSEPLRHCHHADAGSGSRGPKCSSTRLSI